MRCIRARQGATRADALADLTGAIVVLPQGVASAAMRSVFGPSAVHRSGYICFKAADGHGSGQRHFPHDARTVLALD
jgi:hypothetical protein